MTESATKLAMIRRIAENPWLQIPDVSISAQADSDLSVDQPTAALSASIVDYAAATLEQGMTHYADVPGVWALRVKIAEFLSTIGINTFPPDNLLVTAGVQESRFLAIQMVSANFDIIGVPAVVHPGVRQALGVRARKTVDIPVASDGRYLARIDDLAATMAAGCRLLYLESPSRLTGAAYDAHEVDAIADLLLAHDGAVIWDQGLAPWAQTDPCLLLAQRAEMADRIVVLGEAWPGMGLESWMIGYIGANAEWFEQMRSQKQIMAICTSVASQYAAVEAASLYPETHSGQMETLGEHRHAIAASLAQSGSRLLPGVVANLLALEAGTLPVRLLHDADIAVADGAAFGAPGIIRLAIPLGAAQRTLLTRLGT